MYSVHPVLMEIISNFDDLLSWTTNDDVVKPLPDLLTAQAMLYSIHHIDDPVRQPWRRLIHTPDNTQAHAIL